MKRIKKYFSFFQRILFVNLFFLQAGYAQDICERMKNAWQKVQTYQCQYRAIAFQNGKTSETIMHYSFQKPNKIRMDIEKPRKGAVLIYNPEMSAKVKVRPFPKMPFMVLNYALTDRRVSSDSGGTIDHSDLGSRMDSFCKDFSTLVQQEQKDSDVNVITLQDITNSKKELRRFEIGKDGTITKIEVLNEKEELVELFEWKDLNLNVPLEPNLFKKF